MIFIKMGILNPQASEYPGRTRKLTPQEEQERVAREGYVVGQTIQTRSSKGPQQGIIIAEDPLGGVFTVQWDDGDIGSAVNANEIAPVGIDLLEAQQD